MREVYFVINALPTILQARYDIIVGQKTSVDNESVPTSVSTPYSTWSPRSALPTRRALDLLYARGAGPDPGSWPKQTVTMSSKTRSKLNRMTKSVGERQL